MNFVIVFWIFVLSLGASRLILVKGMGLCELSEKLADAKNKSHVPTSTQDDVGLSVSTSYPSTDREQSTKDVTTVQQNPSTDREQSTKDDTTVQQTSFTTQSCKDGEMFLSIDCLERCTCSGLCNQIDGCSVNAKCKVSGGVGQCICNRGYEGDGETCSPLYTDCHNAYHAGHRQDGVYSILPAGWPGSPFNVSCDMTTPGGGWTIFQRRVDGQTDFYRNWESYKYGFGSPDNEADVWLGNEQLFFLTNQKQYRLRIDIVGADYKPVIAQYESFRIGNESTRYQLTDLGNFSGTINNGMAETLGNAFSTYDADNDGCGLFNCAEEHRGAWWYTHQWCSCSLTEGFCYVFPVNNSCHNNCAISNLNGIYGGGPGRGLYWHQEVECNVVSSEMKIIPV